jgi:hypothetical protein
MSKVFVDKSIPVVNEHLKLITAMKNTRSWFLVKRSLQRRFQSKTMETFPIVILGGGVVAGYAAKEFVAQSGKKGELAIVTAENALPYERPSLSKGFLSGKEEASDIQISNAAFYREHGIAVHRNFPVEKVDFRRRRLHSDSGKVIGFDQLLIATGSTVRRLKGAGSQPARSLLSAADEGFAGHPGADQTRPAGRGDRIRLYWNGGCLRPGQSRSAHDHGLSRRSCLETAFHTSGFNFF